MNTRQFNVGTKIRLGYISILVIQAVVAIILIVNMLSMGSEFSYLIEHDLVVVDRANELDKLIVDMESGQRGYLITGEDDFRQPYHDAVIAFDQVAAELRELIADNPEQIERLDKIVATKNDWVTRAAEPEMSLRERIDGMMVSESNMSKMNTMISVVAARTGKRRVEALRGYLAEFIQVEREAETRKAETLDAHATQLLILSIGLTVGSAILGLTISNHLGRSISHNIRQVMEAAERVAAGDLKQTIVVRSNDELQRLAEAFNTMARSLEQTMASQVAKEYLEGIITEYRSFVQRVADGDLSTRLALQNESEQHTTANDDLHELGQNLNMMVERLGDMVVQIKDTANSVSSVAAEILAVTTQQIASVTEQDAAVTQTVATVEEVRATVQQTAQRTHSVAEAARQSARVSLTGQEAVGDTVAGMTLVQTRVMSIAENILALSERTQQIGEIIETVNELAEQSKLLALNASIEAARAGEDGRGFAVVAMEVRQLAEQSREATARVRDILNQIQQATNTAVMVTEEGSKGAESGMQLVQRAGDAIRNLSQTIDEANQLAMQIAASTQQQTNGMDQLAAAMQQIKAASVQTAASTRQAERSARDLHEMAREMEAAIARYRLG